MADKDEKTVPDWQRLRYPDKATFDRLLRDHEGVVYDGEKNDYRVFHAIPGWIRLAWPNEALWRRAGRVEEVEEAMAGRAAGHKVRIPDPWPVSKIAWAAIMAMYPDREGVAENEQDVVRLLTYWPDCFGQPMVEVFLRASHININSHHYGPGRHRVPVSVAAVLRDIDRRSGEEVLKAAMPKNHPDRERVISALSGVAS